MIKKILNILFPMLELEFDLISVEGDYLKRLKDSLNKRNISWEEKEGKIKCSCKVKNLINGLSFTNIWCIFEKVEEQGIKVIVKFTTLTKLLFALLFLQLFYFTGKFLENEEYHYLIYFLLYAILISNILFWASIVPTYRKKFKSFFSQI